MTINNHVQEFAGLPVVTFAPGQALPADPSAVAWRVEVDDWDSPAAELARRLTALVDAVPTGALRALVIGQWGEPSDTPAPVDLLVGLAPRLAGLRALFLGDMTYEECEISWIVQADVTPLLSAFPALAELRVRGGQGLALEPVRHEALRRLTVEAGGLGAPVSRAVAGCDLPALEHLELWFGVEDYGGDTTVADLAPLLTGERLPALRYLGLRNAQYADDIAAAVAAAPVVARLHTLDLSLGTLGDTGAQALLDGQPLAHLTRLDLHRHYLSDEMMARLPAALPGVRVDVSGQQKENTYGRYTAVGE